VVLPEYRSHNIGTLLKLAQREFAVKFGIQLVTWTFDPLLARNAYLNLFKLGAIGQKYAVNYFGTGGEYTMLNEDRLVVNWWVLHSHTLAHVRAEAPKYTLNQYLEAGTVLLNPATVNIAGLPEPPEKTAEIAGDTLLLEIPLDAPALEKRDTGLMRAWRNHIQIMLTGAFDAGYLVTNFVRDEDRTFYVLTRDDGTYDFTRSLL
jgi:predicted GNAT superfamily acetyltransferase